MNTCLFSLALNEEFAGSKLTVSQVASWEQNNLSNVFRLTDVWARGVKGWQVVARHSSVLG